jgi:spermidine synthase
VNSCAGQGSPLYFHANQFKYRVVNARGTRRVYHAAIVLLILSGAAALGHQLLWTRRLTDLLGASAESSVRVFSCFFFGLGLGSALAAVWVHRITRPFLVLARLEAGIILTTLPILFLPELTDWIWPQVGPEILVAWEGGLIKFLLSTLMIVPPATLMGFGFPVVVRGVMAGGLQLGREGINLYACNTIGGVLGLMLLAGIVLPLAGASGSMIAMMAINAVLGVAFWRLHVQAQPWVEKPFQECRGASSSGRLDPAMLVIAAFSGAGVMAAEVAAFKMYTLVATMSFHTPTALLVAVILLLAISAWLMGPLSRWCGGLSRAIVLYAALAGLCLALAPVIYMAIVTRKHPYVSNPSVLVFMLKFAGITILTIGPAVFFAGMLFPASLKWLGEDGDDTRGRRLGWLLAVNGLGGLLGAEITYRWLLPWLGVYQTLGAVGLAYTLFAIALLAWRAASRAPFVIGVTTVSTLLVAGLMYGKLPKIPHVNASMGFTLIDEKNGREGHLAVIEHSGMGRAIMMSNQYVLGSSRAKYMQERQAHLPLLLHPAPRVAGFIGHATGMTPGAAVMHDAVEAIVSVEIAGAVIKAATEHFAELNHDIAHVAHARVLNEDGRTYFAACRERFDVIEADLFLPWGAGVGRLYSREHFASVHDALRPGGIFCQWLPMYQLTAGQFTVIANTFKTAFPRTHLFRLTFKTRHPGLALVGFKEADLDWNVVDRRCAEARAENRIGDPSMRHREGIAMLYFGRYETKKETPLNTLENLWIELDAARERLTGKPNAKYHIGGLWLKWQQDFPRLFDRPTGGFDHVRMAGLGFTLSNWEQAMIQKDERAQVFELLLSTNLPPALMGDTNANWIHWPGTKRPVKGAK